MTTLDMLQTVSMLQQKYALWEPGLIRSMSASATSTNANAPSLLQVQELQKQLLELVLKKFPEAMYPAAMCALADLKEVSPRALKYTCSTTKLCGGPFQSLGLDHARAHYGFLTEFSFSENLQVSHTLWHRKQHRDLILSALLLAD